MVIAQEEFACVSLATDGVDGMPSRFTYIGLNFANYSSCLMLLEKFWFFDESNLTRVRKNSELTFEALALCQSKPLAQSIVLKV